MGKIKLHGPFWDKEEIYPSDIKHDCYYVQSHLMRLRDNDGHPIYHELLAARDNSIIPVYDHIKNSGGGRRRCRLFYGKEILQFIETHGKQLIERHNFASELDYNDIMQVLKRNDALRQENKALREKIKEVDLKEKQLKLQETALINEQNRFDTIKDAVIGMLFGKKTVKLIQADLVKAYCGIYVLFENGEPVYIGQSVNIPARIAQHKNMGKEFDEVRFFECKRDELNEKERFLINLFKPKLNGSFCKSDTEIFTNYLNQGAINDQERTTTTAQPNT